MFRALKKLFSTVALSAAFGCIVGIILGMTIYSARQRPLWGVAAAAVLLLVCSGGLRRLFLDRNWLGFGGRAALLVCAGFVTVGTFSFLLGLFETFDRIDGITFAGSFAVSFLSILGFNLLAEFGSGTVLYREGEKLFNGLFALGVLSGGRKR